MKINQVLNTNPTKSAIVSWLWLIILTFISVYMALFIESKPLFIISALAIVFLKGQQIIDIFMELNQAPKFWRMLLLSYVVLIPTIIGFIYLL